MDSLISSLIKVGHVGGIEITETTDKLIKLIMTLLLFNPLNFIACDL